MGNKGVGGCVYRLLDVVRGTCVLGVCKCAHGQHTCATHTYFTPCTPLTPPQVREIYETAIEGAAPYQLADADTRVLALKYATLERKLGEIDRARAVYVFASSLADPRGDKGFWEQWNDFEVQHGNEDTFRYVRLVGVVAWAVVCGGCVVYAKNVMV